jgi:chromosome segregation ATPase
MPEEKLTEEEKAALQDALKGAGLSDADVRRIAEGEDESGQTTLPVESGEDLLSAATSALDFVEKLEGSAPKAEAVAPKDAVAGFDALLRKLETLRSDIAALQRGVVSVFAAQLLTFRGKVVELKSRISDEMVEKLRMQFFKSFIEQTFVDIVDNEFAALEKELVDKIVQQTQEKFKEFATRVRESEVDLRGTIVQQQDVVRSFMQSLEEDAAAQREILTEKETEIRRLEGQIRQLQSKIDSSMGIDMARGEITRRVSELESEIASLKQEVFQKDSLAQAETSEAEKAHAEVEELRVKVGELQSELAVYKTEKETAKGAPRRSEAEVKTLQSKVDLLEKAMSEKRKEAEALAAKAKGLELELSKSTAERTAAEKESRQRLKELESIEDRIREVKNLEDQVHTLQQDLKTAKDKASMVEMQREAYEKATRLMEKERDLALERRDLSDERTKRYIKALGLDKNTKVLVMVDEVGSITFADLAKSLGTQVALVAKAAREFEKLGVLKIEGDRAVSTLKEVQIQEGEVKV